MNYATLTEKNKGPVHDLTTSICDVFAMCASCGAKENSGHIGRFLLCNIHLDQRLVNIIGILQTIALKMLAIKNSCWLNKVR